MTNQDKQRRFRHEDKLETKISGNPYVCIADAGTTTLLPEAERNFEVPSPRKGGKGFPGTSHVWYPLQHRSNIKVVEFIKDLRKYINSHTSLTTASADDISSPHVGKPRRSSKPDAANNLAVELAAVEFATRHYELQGYNVKSVESENLGWDLHAEKDQSIIYVEVKGVSKSTIYFELTPNEYKKLKEKARQFRVCVVCNALHNPMIFELAPKKLATGWFLQSIDGKVYVPLTERTGAIGVQTQKTGKRPRKLAKTGEKNVAARKVVR